MKAEFRAVIPGGSAAEERPRSINSLAHSFIHPLVQSIRQSLGKHLSTYHVLGQMLGSGGPHENRPQPDIEVVWLDHLKLY